MNTLSSKICDGGSLHNIFCWNIVQSANSYSQFAGILSSFVFATIILALSNPPKNKQVRDISLPLYSSFIAFCCLLSSTFLFALLSGEETDIRAIILGFIAGISLTFGVLQVILTIIWFFKDYEVDASIVSSTFFLFRGVLIIVILNLITTFDDIIWIKTEGKFPAFQLAIYSVAIGIAMYIFPLVAAFFLRQKSLSNSEVDKKFFLHALHCSAVLAIMTTFFYGIVINISEKSLYIIGIDNFLEIMVWIGSILTLTFFFFFFLYQMSLPILEKVVLDSTSKVQINASFEASLLKEEKNPEEIKNNMDKKKFLKRIVFIPLVTTLLFFFLSRLIPFLRRKSSK